MSLMPFNARILARKAFPNRIWSPIEAWDDKRYHRAFASMRAKPDELAAQRIAAQDADGPVFSIVVPLYKTPRDYLDDMVQSVLAQTYPRWELILVNASPGLDDLASWLNAYAQSNEQIHIVTLEDNYGITENTNRGIAAATGDYVSFMDHDDWLEPDTLFEYAAAIRQHGDIDLMYCDEDMVERTKEGWHYCHPLFKPDFSPELLICKNYVLHLLTVSKTVLESLPIPGSEFDGAQDFNLTLRASEVARRVHHVPKVLYHWRISEGSTATNSDAKPYGKQAYRLSVERHLHRIGPQGSIISSGVVNNYNVWFRPDGSDKVSLIVVRSSEKAGNSFKSFVDAFVQVNTYANVEVLLVDDNAQADTAPSHERLEAVKAVTVPPHAGLLERFNIGAKEASGDYLVFLDSSCIFQTAEAIEQIVGMHKRPGMGIVAPKTLYSNLTVKSYGVGVSHAGIVPLYRGYDLDYPSYQCNTRTFLNASAVGYQGLSISKALFEEIGGFDTDFTGEIGSVSLCQQALELHKRIVVTSTVAVLTTERQPDRVLDERPGRLDYPADEIELLHTKLPSTNTPFDPFRGPHLDQRSSYPIIDYGD